LVEEGAGRQDAEAGGSKRDRLEEGAERTLDRGAGAQGRRVAPLDPGDGERPDDDDRDGREQADLRLERKPDPAALDRHVPDDREPEPAEQDEDGDGHEHADVALEAGQAVPFSDEVSARVVSRGHSVEHAPPERRERALAVEQETDGEYERADPLDDER